METDDLPKGLSAANTAKFFIMGAIGLCVLTVIAVIVLSIFVEEPTAIIATVLGVTTPITMALLAAGVQGLATALDGKMTQLLGATAEKEHLKGQLEGLRENPKTNL